MSVVRAVLLSACLFTPGAGAAETMRLMPRDPYAETTFDRLPRGTVIDAQGADLRVANSGTRTPRRGAECDTGGLPTNPYPLKLDDSGGASLVGARIAGEVPQDSDWEHTYCNSAAVLLRDSPDVMLDRIRIDAAWDGVRVSGRSAGFVLRRAWLSRVRDDCLENDFLLPGRIEDVLFDGCFVGISTRPPSGRTRASDGRPLILDGVLMRLAAYPYKGELEEGPPFKAERNGPPIEIRNSIVAMASPDSVSASRVRLGWDEIGTCEDNLLLWLADTPWPESFGRPPSCFKRVSGARARTIWTQAREDWIACHPEVPRLRDDAASGRPCQKRATRSWIR